MHLAKIHASSERIYEVLTTDEGIGNWWTHDTLLDSKIGGTGEFGFYERKVVTNVSIVDLMPPVRVSWTTISPSAPGGWNATTITFDLRKEGSNTVFSFAHRGFQHAHDGYARVTPGWAYFLASLQCYISISRPDKARPADAQDQEQARYLRAKTELGACIMIF